MPASDQPISGGDDHMSAHDETDRGRPDGADTSRMLSLLSGALALVIFAIVAAAITVVVMRGGSADLAVDGVPANTASALAPADADDSATDSDDEDRGDEGHNDDDPTATTVGTDEPDTSMTNSSTTDPTPTSADEPTLDPALFEIAIWPWFDTDVRYEDPVDAASGFAEAYLGYAAPMVTGYRAGDQRSAEVDIAAVPGGEAMRVATRQLADGTWWVLAAESASLIIERPTTGTTLVDPLVVVGQAVTPDGTAQLVVRADGADSAAVLTGVATGIAPGPRQRFETTIGWSPPPTGHGAVALIAFSPDTGRPVAATVQRVAFAG